MQGWPSHGSDTVTAVPSLSIQPHTSENQTSTFPSLAGAKAAEFEPQSANGRARQGLYPALSEGLSMN